MAERRRNATLKTRCIIFNLEYSMYNTTYNDKEHKSRTIICTDDSARRNPIAVALQKRYANTSASGFHEDNKYSRKTKHKKSTE